MKMKGMKGMQSGMMTRGAMPETMTMTDGYMKPSKPKKKMPKKGGKRKK